MTIIISGMTPLLHVWAATKLKCFKAITSATPTFPSKAAIVFAFSVPSVPSVVAVAHTHGTLTFPIQIAARECVLFHVNTRFRVLPTAAPISPEKAPFSSDSHNSFSIGHSRIPLYQLNRSNDSSETVFHVNSTDIIGQAT